jgi:hypothetical protein
MSATRYVAGPEAAEAQPAQAQDTLDTHVSSSATEPRRAHPVVGPGLKREHVSTIFWRHPRRPRRIPGTTQPERVSALSPATSWFGHAQPDAGPCRRAGLGRPLVRPAATRGAAVG